MAPLQGADQVNAEIEVGFDERFERSWEFAERIGRLVMLAFVAIGLAGFLGRGPYSHETARSPASAIAVDYEPVTRSQTGTQVTFHLSNPKPTSALTMDLFIGSNIVEPMGLQRIIPQPVAINTVDGGLVLTVAVPPGTADADLRLMLLPVGIGPQRLVARLDDHADIHWTQVVVP